jgi:hypothetical protein
MIGEAELDGVFVPYLLILAVASFFVLLPLRWLLRRLNLYRFVWHAGLFDTALFLVILSGLAWFTARLGPGAMGS